MNESKLIAVSLLSFSLLYCLDILIRWRQRFRSLLLWECLMGNSQVAVMPMRFVIIEDWLIRMNFALNFTDGIQASVSGRKPQAKIILLGERYLAALIWCCAWVLWEIRFYLLLAQPWQWRQCHKLVNNKDCYCEFFDAGRWKKVHQRRIFQGSLTGEPKKKEICKSLTNNWGNHLRP